MHKSTITTPSNIVGMPLHIVYNVKKSINMCHGILMKFGSEGGQQEQKNGVSFVPSVNNRALSINKKDAELKVNPKAIIRQPQP